LLSADQIIAPDDAVERELRNEIRMNVTHKDGGHLPLTPVSHGSDKKLGATEKLDD
jgi:hypothetical protein